VTELERRDHESPLTLCLIVKDEEAFLEDCLASAAPVCRDVVVVDTGSRDRTIKIARRWTERVFDHPTAGNFSAARNRALEEVETPWVLFLDADERFEAGEAAKLRGLVENAPSEVLGFRVLRYNFFATGGFYTGRELKLMRSDPRIRYRRKINESVTESIADAAGTVPHAPILLNHFGHTRPPRVRDAKAHHYMQLMQAQLEVRPDDAILHGYIALILRTLGRFAEALEWSDKSLVLGEEIPTVWAFRGHVLRSIGDRDAEAMAAYRTGVTLSADDAALWNMVGVMHLSLSEFDAALDAFVRAQALDPSLAHVQINLGLLHEAQERWDAALAEYRAAAARNAAFLFDSWNGRTERDPFRCFYYETIFQYAGLGHHLGYCLWRSSNHAPARTAS
jgi:glycosyltransferase involved in cell wall biosynthesis